MTWQKLEKVDPYGHWWWPKSAIHARIEDNDPLKTKLMEQEFRSANVDLFEQLLTFPEKTADGRMESLKFRAEAASQLFQGGSWVAQPVFMMNQAFPKPDPGDPVKWMTRDFVASLPDDLSCDTLLVGIIDTGVPLHHSRTRMGDTLEKTRIVASWQQAADWQLKKQPFAPFGQMLVQNEINRLLEENRASSGAIEEDSFNRAAGLVDPQNILGHRDLDFRASHGAHVLDLAGGMDPFADPDSADKVRFLVVNLPPQFLHGLAGNFLQYYASFALQWMHDVAAALWKKNKANKPSPCKSLQNIARDVSTGLAETFGKDGKERKKEAFDLAVNLSFGMNAGPKDGNMPFEILFDKLALREPGERAPKRLLNLTMPAGNDNLRRKTARLDLTPDTFSELSWRTLPGDQTSNFLEIWTNPVPHSAQLNGDCLEADQPADTMSSFHPSDFELKLTQPDGTQIALRPASLVRNQFHDLPDVAQYEEGFGRVFAQIIDREAGGGRKYRRLRFIVALRPSINDYFLPEEDQRPSAPAGVWSIAIRCDRSVSLDVNIQSDQARFIHSVTSQPAYLDDINYRRFDAQGRLKDSFDYDQLTHATDYLELGEGPVLRVGTVNAMAANRKAVTVGGYRGTDGKPTDYSATGYLNPDYEGELRRAEMAMPTDDGVAHVGVLGAGASDGSCVPFMGTSMASALATRMLVDAWLCEEDRPKHRLFRARWFRRRAEDFEVCLPNGYAKVAHAKAGAGRTAYPAGYLKGRAPRRS